MATFIIKTDTDHDHEKVMEIVRKRSVLHSNAHGGPGYCDTEVKGTWEDYKVFENAIGNGIFKGELEKLSDETL